MFLTKSGVDLEVFPYAYKPEIIKTLGFVGKEDDLKRFCLFKEIANEVKLPYTKIENFTNEDGYLMYENVDLLI